LHLLCVRKTPHEIGPNRSFSVFLKHNALQFLASFNNSKRANSNLYQFIFLMLGLF